MKHSVFLVTIFFLCSLSNVVIGSDKKNDFRFIGKDSNTALINAVKEGDIETVEWLLDNGFDVNAVSGYGYTALILAATRGYIEIAKLLIKYGANVNLADRFGNTALIYTVGKFRIDIVELLIVNGIYVDQVNQNGNTALMWAIEKGCTDIAKLLIKYGANINLADRFGDTALMHAIYYDCTETVKLLIEYGADVNAVNKDDETALIFAIYQGRTEIVKLLIEYGADVNTVPDKQGNTALMYAAKGGYIKIVKLLIEHGAHVDVINKYSNTALTYAAKSGYIKIVKLLEKKIASINRTVKNIANGKITYNINRYKYKCQTVGFLLMLEKEAKSQYPKNKYQEKWDIINDFFKKIFKDKQDDIAKEIITNRMSLTNVELLLCKGYLDPNTIIIDEFHPRCLPSLFDCAFVSNNESLQELLLNHGGLFSFDNDDDILHSWEIKEESIDEKKLRLKYLKYMNNNDKKYIS